MRHVFDEGTVTGNQITLGRAPIGRGTYKGWKLRCSKCAWRYQVNDGKRAAVRVAKDHACPPGWVEGER